MYFYKNFFNNKKYKNNLIIKKHENKNIIRQLFQHIKNQIKIIIKLM